jgi:tRNA pseudouridine55 synthase
MNSVLVLNKQVGETPLACMEQFRDTHPEYQGVKMTYAGRLDPIASGLLIVLTGDKVHEKESYLGLPKTYECIALLGVKTDTYDVLGIPVGDPLLEEERVDSAAGRVRLVLEGFVGTFQQTYPPYSSKTVDGKQLHQIARSGDIATVELPSRTVTVYEVGGVTGRISRSEIRRQITDIVSRVTGDFRQDEIISAWERLLQEGSSEDYELTSFTISVSSGTYIRSIVNSLGEKIGSGACILELHRTKVGDFKETNVDKS